MWRRLPHWPRTDEQWHIVWFFAISHTAACQTTQLHKDFRIAKPGPEGYLSIFLKLVSWQLCWLSWSHIFTPSDHVQFYIWGGLMTTSPNCASLMGVSWLELSSTHASAISVRESWRARHLQYCWLVCCNQLSSYDRSQHVFVVFAIKIVTLSKTHARISSLGWPLCQNPSELQLSSCKQRDHVLMAIMCRITRGCCSCFASCLPKYVC